jgi:hypothetical protein
LRCAGHGARTGGTTMYRDRIRATLARQGKPEIDPRWVEAWMRLEYGTLDHLGGRTWTREVKVAAQCVEAATAEQNEALARSVVGRS